jgi:Undecaprenyl-phosphate glucose phosphotransferase
VLSKWAPSSQYIVSALTITLLVLFGTIGFKHYVGIQRKSRDRFMWNGLGAVALAFSMFLSIMFVLKVSEDYSRGTFYCQLLACSAAILIMRGIVHTGVARAICSGAVEARRAVVIGDLGAHSEILDNLRRSGVRSVDVLPFPHIHGNTVPGVGFSQTLRKLVDRCRLSRPDDIFFLAAPSDWSRVACVADALSELPVAIHIVPVDTNELWSSSQVAQFGGTTAIQVLHPPLSLYDAVVKRAFDMAAAFAGLLLLAPLFVMVALAIKLDSRGPIFFRQKRHGYNNETINVFKFRSMTTMEDGHKTFTQAVRNDPRVTRVGRILRTSNIDELPQLINVLLGDMSMVGPRPHPIALNEAFRDRILPFQRRHKIKPGITGWAQVNGFRGETDTVEKMRNRVEHDIYYVDNWSFVLDIKIILMTAFSRRSYTNAV